MKTRKWLLATSILFVTTPMVTLISCSSEGDENVTISSLNKVIEAIDYKNETHGDNRKIELYERIEKEGILDLDMMLTLGIKFQIPEFTNGTVLYYTLERTEDFVFYEKAKYKVTVIAKNQSLVSTEKIEINIVSINEYDMKTEVNTNMINFNPSSSYQSTLTSTEIDAIVDRYVPIFEDTVTNVKYEDVFFMGSLSEDSIFEELGIDAQLPDLEKTPNSIYKFALYKNNLTVGQKHSYSMTVYCKANHIDTSIFKYVTELRFHKTFTFESTDILDESQAKTLVDEVYQAYESDTRFDAVAPTSQVAKSWAQVDRTKINQFGPAGTGILGSGAEARFSIMNTDVGAEYPTALAIRELKQKGVNVIYEYPREELIPEDTDNADDEWIINQSTNTSSTTPLLQGKMKIRFTINGLNEADEKKSELKFRSSNVATATESLDYYQFQSFRGYDAKNPLVSSKTGDELYEVLKNTTMPAIKDNGIKNILSANIEDIPPFITVLGLEHDRDFMLRYRLNFQAMSLKQTTNARFFQVFCTDVGGIMKGKVGYQFTLKVDMINPTTENFVNKPAFFVVRSSDYIGLDKEIQQEVQND